MSPAATKSAAFLRYRGRHHTTPRHRQDQAMKYKSKVEFVANTKLEWKRLWELIDGVPENLLVIRIGDEHPRSITDHLAHLYSWHRLLLQWIGTGTNGKPDLPCQGYRWNQTRALNQKLHEQCEDQSYRSIRRKLKLSHGRVMKFVDQLSETKLLHPDHFLWTGKLPIVSYIGPNTAGHYRWAQKKVKRAKSILIG